MRATVAVVGAGIAGRLVAWELARRDWAVTVFDSHEGERSASYAAAGLLAPFVELETTDEPVARLGLRAMARWPSVVEACGVPEALSLRGSLVVAHARDAAELRRLADRVRNAYRDGVAVVERDALTELEPGLDARFRRGLFFPGEGYVDNRAVLIALDRALGERGVTRRYGEAVVRVIDGAVRTPRERHVFDQVVDCRGLGARPSLPDLRGVRGEIVRVHAPEVALSRPVRCLHPRYPIYIVPRPDGEYVIGATCLETQDEGPVTVRSLLELLSSAYALHPGFGEARVRETAARCRPAFPDNRPRLRVTGRVVHVNGLYRHGFLVGPEVAHRLAEYLDSGARPDRELLPLEEEKAA